MKRKKDEKKEERLFGWVAENFGEATRDLIMGCGFENIRGFKGGLDKRILFNGQKILKEGE